VDLGSISLEGPYRLAWVRTTTRVADVAGSPTYEHQFMRSRYSCPERRYETIHVANVAGGRVVRQGGSNGTWTQPREGSVGASEVAAVCAAVLASAFGMAEGAADFPPVWAPGSSPPVPASLPALEPASRFTRVYATSRGEQYLLDPQTVQVVDSLRYAWVKVVSRLTLMIGETRFDYSLNHFAFDCRRSRVRLGRIAYVQADSVVRQGYGVDEWNEMRGNLLVRHVCRASVPAPVRSGSSGMNLGPAPAGAARPERRITTAAEDRSVTAG
jgi:hypothetical protein